MDGVEFNGGDNDGADLDRGDFDCAKMDGVNFVRPDADIPESSNSKRGVNMGSRQNKNLKRRRKRLWYNTMKWAF